MRNIKQHIDYSFKSSFNYLVRFGITCVIFVLTSFVLLGQSPTKESIVTETEKESFNKIHKIEKASTESESDCGCSSNRLNLEVYRHLNNPGFLSKKIYKEYTDPHLYTGGTNLPTKEEVLRKYAIMDSILKAPVPKNQTRSGDPEQDCSGAIYVCDQSYSQSERGLTINQIYNNVG
jgi:hypothetical protein